MDSRPIGIFDSGIGGLTVAREIFRHLPNENVVYFGDTARVPYGTKSPDTVRKFSISNVRFLLSHNVKLIVVACNTASSLALKYLRRKFSCVPIIGVIEPAVELALICTQNKRIGVIGTESTILSNAYSDEIKRIEPGISVFKRPCPLFVPLVEEGWTQKRETLLIAREYLKPLKKNRIDTLILGCTHYPLLRNLIKKVMGKGVAIIDSAGVVAEEVREVLKERDLLNNGKKKGRHLFFVSDNPERFTRIGKNFLGEEVRNVRKVDIEKF